MRGAVLLLLFAGAVAAKEPLSWEDRTRLRVLVERLASPDPALRDAAAAGLLEEGARAGPAVSDWLLSLEPRDPEVRAVRDAVCARIHGWTWVEGHIALFRGIVPDCADAAFGRAGATTASCSRTARCCGPT